MTTYAGIDYSLGRSNIDRTNGIHYGIIPINSEAYEALCDSLEPTDEPTCPKCGNEALDSGDERIPHTDERLDWEYNGVDFACLACKYTFYSDEAFPDPDESQFERYDGAGYLLERLGNDGDVFVLKSNFFTYAQYCSPCAPGAGYLLSPCDEGPRTYCLAHDWFYSGKAPYRVFKVIDGSEV